MIGEQIRRLVTSAIGTAYPSPPRYYHVCYWQNGIRCLDSRHTRRAHPVFLTLPSQVFAAELSPHQWRVLTHRIIYICKMTGLTLDELSREPTCATYPGSKEIPS